MGSYCKECSIDIWGHDDKDFAGLVSEGEKAIVLCEGCGRRILVDHEGKRVPPEMKDFQPGTIIRNHGDSESYIVTMNYGDHAIAVRSISIRNPDEWIIFG